MITRPMLAATLKDVNTIKFPVLASPKLDGIRCVVIGKKALTRKFKSIPNQHIREQIDASAPNGCDGELLTFTNGKLDDFNTIQSKVTSFDGEPAFVFCVFDHVEPESLEEPFTRRLNRALAVIAHLRGFAPVQHKTIVSVEEFERYEEWCLANGYEGVMIRDPNGAYKCGRSTLKEGGLLKLKRFEDAEASVIGFIEKMKNENAKEVDELGLTKRSKKKGGLVGADTLGALRVRLPDGREFEIGSGFTDNLRKEIWENRDDYFGKLVTFKYQLSGGKNLPRFSIFKGFRSALDT